MQGERAVVLGGSIGGLFAARVLADHFESVTVIERDRQAARLVDQSWALSAGEDLRHPEVKGPRPTGSSFINAYVERLHRASHTQPDVHRAMVEVFSLHRPLTTLLNPRMALRALRATRPWRVPPHYDASASKTALPCR
jgi:glycine/D-amino acid oxidase-like deaminating enzyme